MADRDDQIGMVDRIMDIVALGQRRGTHVETGAPCDGTGFTAATGMLSSHANLYRPVS